MPRFAPLFRMSGIAIGILTPTLLLTAADPDDGLSKKMLPIYVKEVEAYTLTVESAPKKELELKKEPVLEWANPGRDKGLSQGALFVWLREGRPAAVACIASYPNKKLPGRVISHELHALDPEKLLVKRDAFNQWKPEAGLVRKVLPDSPEPAATSATRQLQMRRLAQEFTGHEIDNEGKRWEMRLLPTPLYKYPTSKTGVIDGALFTLVSNSGTKPDILLLIEAREVEGKLRWEYVCGRFADWELHVERKDMEVFSSIRSETNPFAFSPLQIYRVYADKVVTPEGKLLAQMHQNPSPPNGKPPGAKLIPVEDK
jgi:hypothetical protein